MWSFPSPNCFSGPPKKLAGLWDKEKGIIGTGGGLARGGDRHAELLAAGLGAALTAEAATPAGATTLDWVHAAMLLQAGGRAEALRALIRAGRERGPDFLRLANALSVLYPAGSEEKRLLDAMLLAGPRMRPCFPLPMAPLWIGIR